VKYAFNIYTIYDIYVLSYYLDGDIYVADICIYFGIYVTPHIYAKIYDFFICHIYFVPYGITLPFMYSACISLPATSQPQTPI